MGTRSRLGLLMLRTILGGNIPPYPPPGGLPPGGSKTARCPTCKKKAVARAGGRFYCQRCGKYFTPGKAN
jgi:hypothetical protein